jgi:hypothetical protein
VTASTAHDGHAKGTEIKGTNGHDDTHCSSLHDVEAIRRDDRDPMWCHQLRTVVGSSTFVCTANLFRTEMNRSDCGAQHVHGLAAPLSALWFTGWRKS